MNTTGMKREMVGQHDWLRWAALCARIALGAAFLSGIADRFGLYRGRNVGYGDFAGFMRYTAKVNSFLPPSTIPFLAWAATIAELFFGIALIVGIWRVWVAWKCSSVDLVWNGHGDFLWHQIPAGLFGFFGLLGSPARCCVRTSLEEWK